MRVFLDVNVLLDVALVRPGFFDASFEVVDWCERNADETFLAPHTPSNLFYILRKLKDGDGAKEVLRDLYRWVDLAPSSLSLYEEALDRGISDYEDALQAASAEACGADVLVTRDSGGFEGCSVRVLTPSEFAAEFIATR